MHRRFVAAAVLAPALLPAVALGGTYSFSNITGNSATNAAAGEAQLSLSALSMANPQLVRFTLTNAAGVASSVKAVFVDDAGLLGGVSGFNATSGVSFRVGTTGSLPGGNSLSNDFDEDGALGVRARSPSPSNGVNPGETLDWYYSLKAGKTFEDVLAALDSGLLRFGVHMTSFTNGGSEAFVSMPNDPGEPNVIPSPLGGAMGAAGLLALAARRRR